MTKPSTPNVFRFQAISEPCWRPTWNFPPSRPGIRSVRALLHLLERLAGGQARVFMGELADITAGTRKFSPSMAAELNVRGKTQLQLPLHAEML